jgi:aarF domain-containing kinase
MANLRRLMTYTNIFPKTMFLDKLLENTRKELFEECDYITEA